MHYKPTTMYQRLQCAVLRTIKYDDRRAIVTAWSAEQGRVSLIVPSGASREARRRRAIMMPLSLFEGEVDIRPSHELLSIRDVRPLRVLTELSGEPTKAVVAMFLSEVLEKVLREAQADTALTSFLFDAIERLDTMAEATGVANFPLVFLFRLCHFLGIEPDMTDWLPGSYFDMRGGQFHASQPLCKDFLTPDQTAFLALLSRLNFDNSRRTRLPRQQRREALSQILRYYTLHHTKLDNLNSLAVVSDIF